MSLYKRPGSKYYWMNFLYNGEVVQLSTKCTSIKAARAFQDDYRSKLRRREIGIEVKEKPPSRTFEEAVKDFLESLAGTVKESTITAYESKSKMPIKRLGKKLVENIERADMDLYVAWRRTTNKKAPIRLLKKNRKATTTKPVSNATINRERTFTAMVINYALPGHWQSIAKPAGGRKLKQLREEPEEGETFHVITLAEEERYLKAANPLLRDVATIILDAGLRPHEVFNLRPEHINFDMDVIRMTKSKTTAGKREVPMTQRVRAIMERRSANSINDLLFPGDRDSKGEKPIVKVTNSHLEAIKNANKLDRPNLHLVRPGESLPEEKLELPKIPRFKLYDCRHTWATRMVEQGCDLMTLKALGGWTSLKMVERYAHPTKQHQADAIRRLEKAHRKAS